MSGLLWKNQDHVWFNMEIMVYVLGLTQLGEWMRTTFSLLALPFIKIKGSWKWKTTKFLIKRKTLLGSWRFIIDCGAICIYNQSFQKNLIVFQLVNDRLKLGDKRKCSKSFRPPLNLYGVVYSEDSFIFLW